MQGTVLKHNVKRTVRLEPGEGSAGHVVKRFHGPGASDRLRDRLRAAREFRVLKALAARGLPVPVAVETRRRAGRWELVTEYLPRARRLDALARSEAPWPEGLDPERLARRLGTLLAAAHATGLEHGDLHPGNVLVDDDGALWLCDLARARLHARLPGRVVSDDLERLGAALRTRVGFGLRARFLLAYRRALPEAVAGRLAPRVLDPARLEHAARARRFQDEARRTKRWLRASSDTDTFRDGNVQGVVRKDLAPRAAQLAALVRATELELDGWFRVPFPGRADVDLCGYAGWRAEQHELAWRGDTRLCMHGVPCARPVLFARGPLPLTLYELPRDASFPLDRFRAADSSERRRLARALGRSLGALHDAGLDIAELGPNHWAVGARAAFLRPAARPVALVPARRRSAWTELERLASPAPLARAAFLSAYLASQQHSRAERESLRAELTRG